MVRAFRVSGTSYSEADAEGPQALDPQNSQSYLAHVATRAIIIVDADGAAGLVAFVAIGMSDVSACMIGDHVKPGYHLTKGEEIGYFQFGGSPYCLVFGPGVVRDVTLAAVPQPRNPSVVPVRAEIFTTR